MYDLAKLFVGSIGSGKTYNAIKEACHFLGVEYNNDNFIQMRNEKRLAFIQLNPNFSYENFVAGVSVYTNQKGKINYEIVDKIFSEMCSEALAHKDLNYCIILDDLDRINVSCLFGELINAIEYRNERVTTSSGKSLIVPDNLLIVGTVNSLKQNDSDYAVLRRFKMQRVVSKKDIIQEFYQEQDQETIESITNLYEKINDFIERNIAPDYLDVAKEYYIGPAFYLKPLTLGQSPLYVVNAIITYIVMPILRQYVADGILECTYQDIVSLQEALMPTSCENTIAQTSRIKKVIYNESEDTWEETDVLLPDTKEEYLQVLQNQPRGYKAELFRLVFESVCFSNIVPINILFNEILNNVNLIRVSNLYANHKTQDLHAAFIAEQTVSEQFQYITQGGKITCSVYSTTAVGNKKKPQYMINGKQYVIASGFRDGGSTASLELYEPSLRAPLYHFEFVYKLVASYYGILIRNFANSSAEILKKLAEIELAYFTNQTKIGDWTDVLPKLSLLWTPAQESIDYSTEKIETLIQKTKESAFVELYESYRSETHQESIVIPEIGVENMANDYKNIMDLLNTHQMILQGPPGTSKTFGAKEFIANRIRETERAIEENAVLLSKNQLSEKDYAFDTKLNAPVYWDIVQFHPSYDYEDFVRGIDVRPGPGGIEYVTVNKTLGKIAELAGRPENSEKEFYLIIDEINRANIASVFGELIYALEYRGNPIATPYVVNGNPTITLPSNLYIIGTMNTADKSIGNIDYAIKRRFIFFSSLSDRNVVLKCANQDEDSIEIMAYDMVAQMFKDYLNSEYNLDDVQLGHTYFLRENQEDETINRKRMSERMRYQVIPILREYFKDGILESNDEVSENEAVAELMKIIENYSTFENADDEISAWLSKYLSE